MPMFLSHDDPGFEAQFAALRRLGVNVGKVRKTRRILEIAPQGVAVRSPQWTANPAQPDQQQSSHATILHQLWASASTTGTNAPATRGIFLPVLPLAVGHLII